MSENNIKLRHLITELNKRREEYSKEGFPLVQKLYKASERGQRKPEEFNESSFLYIGTYTGDLGERPLPSMNYWNSPDISFAPVTGLTPLTTNELQAGVSYRVRCLLHNRGDVMVPFPKVEFWLADPSLGFDTRFSTFIGVTQMDGLLLANGTGEAEFIYRVPPEESGHKCFFARTFSFSPLDKPHDSYALDPRSDRHIGQKNLHIIKQGSLYNFSLIHMPNMQESIQFIPMTIKEIIGLGDPLLGRFNFKENRSADLIHRQSIKSLNANIQIKSDPSGFIVSAQGEGPSVREQTKIIKNFNNAIIQIGSGKSTPSKFKDVFAAKRQMNAFMKKTNLSIALPEIELKPQEAIAFNIINTNIETGLVKGGITLVITGKE